MTWTFKLARRIAASHRRSSVLPAVVIMASLTACGSDITTPDTTTPPAPVSGWLTVQVDTPNSNDGALQLQVSGPSSIDSLKGSGYTGYSAAQGTSGELIITGSVHDGTVGRFWVSDVAKAGQYHVVIVAAAARGSYALQDLQGYSATVTR